MGGRRASVGAASGRKDPRDEVTLPGQRLATVGGCQGPVRGPSADVCSAVEQPCSTRWAQIAHLYMARRRSGRGRAVLPPEMSHLGQASTLGLEPLGRGVGVSPRSRGLVLGACVTWLEQTGARVATAGRGVFEREQWSLLTWDSVILLDSRGPLLV